LLISRELLGKTLYTSIAGELTAGVIVETEAYAGPDDRGSHAFNNRRTPRNEMMYAQGGVVYMYICYGIHDMLNIVTGPEGTSHAILIRAVEPTEGIGIMRSRRNVYNADHRLCQGPGALGQAFGLNKTFNGKSLTGDEIWIEDQGTQLNQDDIATSGRVGMNFEGPYKSIPWRFYVRGNSFVSKPRG
jgi:DNA-3-methyladenine glycosylase